MPSFPFGQSEEKPEEAAHEKMVAVESSAKEQLAETAQEARVRIAKELNSDNFTISLGGCDPIRGTGDKSCCFSRGITCTNPPNPFKAAETGCPLGALCTAPLNVNPFAPPSYGYCQCQGGSPCEGGQSCGMPSFPFGESKDEPKEASQKDLGAIESSAKVTEAKVGLETEQEARVRIAKELNSNNFTISLGQCDPIRGGGDKSCCFERGVTCTNPPNPMKAFETGCPIGAMCTAQININPFAPPAYGYCQCQGGMTCNGGQSCGLNFPNPFGESKKAKLEDDEPKTAAASAALVGSESQEAAKRSEETLNSTGSCIPGTSDLSCCMARGATCTNPPNPFDMSTSCPPGAICSAGFNVNPFAGPQYGYCQCQLGAHCAADGNSCGGAGVGNPFLKCTGGLQDPPTCCPKRYTCTNPPMLNNLSTTCGLGQACDADPTVLGGHPTFGTCKCITGACGAEGHCNFM